MTGKNEKKRGNSKKFIAFFGAFSGVKPGEKPRGWGRCQVLYSAAAGGRGEGKILIFKQKTRKKFSTPVGPGGGRVSARLDRRGGRVRAGRFFRGIFFHQRRRRPGSIRMVSKI